MDLRLLPQQQLKVTPKQIAANYILQLSSLELQDVINQELQENPALDLEEVQACPLCGQPLAGRVCLNCFGTGKGPYKGSDDIETEPLEGTSLMQRDEEEDELDPIVRAEAEQTLAEYLSWNTRVFLPKRLHPVAEYIIGNLNDAGFLELSIEEIAKTLKVSVADAASSSRSTSFPRSARRCRRTSGRSSPTICASSVSTSSVISRRHCGFRARRSSRAGIG